MRRQNSAHQFPFARDHQLLIVERIAAALGDQRCDVLLFEKKFIEPCNLRQDLQVGEILRLKISLGALGMVTVLAKPLEQLAVTRIAPDHILRIGLKEILQGEAPLIERQIFRRLRSHPQKRILRRPVGIVLNLHHQRRHKIEILVDVGKLVQQFDHAVVVLEGVQTGPGQTIFAGDQILVERLVLVPQKNDAESRHEWRGQSSMGDSEGTDCGRQNFAPRLVRESKAPLGFLSKRLQNA